MALIAREWMGSRHGATTSFDDLFLREYGRVVAVAQRVLGDSAEAEDVAQDVFCSFYGKHPPDAPYAAAWLHRAASHTALNVVRGRRRRQQREAGEALAEARSGALQPESLDPLHSLERAEERREVRAALARLPEKSAAILALRYSGLSYTEVATALGVNTNQIGTLLRRAEAALRKEMHDETPS
ncbi:MAG: RNA polymerase sigma factor [Dehalococcoidia bacterium]